MRSAPQSEGKNGKFNQLDHAILSAILTLDFFDVIPPTIHLYIGE